MAAKLKAVLQLPVYFGQVYGLARCEPDELSVFLYPEQDDEKCDGAGDSGDKSRPGRACYSESRCSEVTVDEDPVEEYVEQVGAYSYPHLVAGVADAL